MDSGATFTFIPQLYAGETGSATVSHESITFEIADGSLRWSAILGLTWIKSGWEANGSFPRSYSEMINATPPLLGAVTLEILRLGIDPVNSRLIPGT